MKITAIFCIMLMVWGLKDVKAQDTVDMNHADKEIVAQELEREALSGQHDAKTKAFLNKIAEVFKNSKSVDVLTVDTRKDDCSNCAKKEKRKDFLTKLGRKLGKGSAWVTTATAKPFMSAAGFVTGAIDKGDKNQDIVALYNFFLNHQEEFDNLYREAGIPEDMIELMLYKMEEIMDKKSRIIMKDFLAHLGVDTELPENLLDFELSADDIANIDPDKIDVAFINNHPEYKEVKPLIGEMTTEELMDIVTSGYFDKAISFENYKAALPNPYELAGTIVGQIFVPKIALGIVSSTLAGLYVAPVVAAQLGTAASTVVCLQEQTKDKFENDDDLRMFCSYITNRTSYQLLKSRAKGYVAGKNFHQKMAERIAARNAKRAEKKR
jgi:hypothetical protein